jgi:Emfourin
MSYNFQSQTGCMKRCFRNFLICLAMLTNIVLFNVIVWGKDTNTQNTKIHMRIYLKAEGGIAFIPGLSQESSVESEDLSKRDLEELQKLIAKARFFELPAKLGIPPSGAADYRSYTVTIEDGGRRHSVQFTDLADNPGLKELFAFLQSLQPKGR